MFIFKRVVNISTSNDPDTWTLIKRVITMDIPEFNGVCMQFFFKLVKAGQDPTQLIFAR